MVVNIPDEIPHQVEWRVRALTQLASCSDPEIFRALFEASLAKAADEAMGTSADLLEKLASGIEGDPRLQERFRGLKAGAAGIRYLRRLDARDADAALLQDTEEPDMGAREQRKV